MQPCPQNAPRFKSYENRVSLTGYLAVLLFLIGIFVAGCDSVVDVGDSDEEEVEEEEEEVERSLSKTIERNYDTEFKAALIDSAEAAYPPRDSVVDAALIHTSVNFDEDDIPESEFWWYTSFDHVLIPFAITGDAVEYYISLMEAIKDERSHGFIKEVEFEYIADISFKEEYNFEWTKYSRDIYEELTGQEAPEYKYKQVYVIDKKLSWYHSCVEHCALNVYIERVVIFDQDGKLKSIYYDGPFWPFSAV